MLSGYIRLEEIGYTGCVVEGNILSPASFSLFFSFFPPATKELIRLFFPMKHCCLFIDFAMLWDIQRRRLLRYGFKPKESIY